MNRTERCADAADSLEAQPAETDLAEFGDDVAHSILLRRLMRLGVVYAAAAALCFALYVILRPENYGLTPNSLDPLFYSGYAINFDDVLNAAGQRHYFVSRWTAYLPGVVSDRIAGPFIGRLLLRLVLASAVLSCIWTLGARQRWNWAQRLFIGGVVVSMPTFVRALFTDYVEYMVVALGICLVSVCLREKATFSSSVVVGILAAAMVVANPVAITVVVLPLAAYVVLAGSGLRQRLVTSAIVACAGGLVVAAGFVWFRWRYGLENVYQPSIDFARNFSGRDAFKSPRVDWLWHFTWLFSTPLLLAVAVGVGVRKIVRFERYEVAAFVLCGAQYTFQWVDQFVRDGNGLEVSYYWSFSYPTFAVALALLVGRLTAGARNRTLLLLLGAWIVVLVAGIPDALRLPAGAVFFALAAVAAGALVLGSTRSATFAGAGLILLVGWTQIGAPAYDPTAYFEINVSPRYDQLYRKAGSLSEVIYGEAVWFEEQMDQIPNDASASFVPVGGWSMSIVALYAPHPIDRIMQMEPEGQRLSSVALDQIRLGLRPIVAVYGPPDEVDAVVSTFAEDLPRVQALLDVTNEARLGYRLVVYAMPDSALLPFEWDAASLPHASGASAGSSVTAEAPDLPGIVTFGPYIHLEPGSYLASLSYASTSAPSDVAGTFDVVDMGGTSVTSIELPGTDGRKSDEHLAFEVDDSDGTWEFRTEWAGLGSFRVDTISLEADGD